MLLAGDLGGTKTLLGLYERDPRRPRLICTREFATLEYGGLEEMIREFLAGDAAKGARVECAVMGVAGPIRNQEVQLTNVPWRLSARDVAARTGLDSLVLLNDVEAMAYAIDVLDAGERSVLQAGTPDASGNAALLSVGTGVGMAILHRIDDRLIPLASEGGHADFAARTEREIALVRTLRPKYGRVEVERVVSGPGLANIGRFTHGGACPQFPAGLLPHDEPAAVSRAALDGTCPGCREALDMFVEAAGAVAGNLGLTTKAGGGVYVGGGVAEKLLPALQSGRFLSAFVAKTPLEELVRSMPVVVITSADAGLLGAAAFANRPPSIAR
jgi:glucokinase